MTASFQPASDDVTSLQRLVTDYAYALDVLDQYDHQVLEIRDTTPDGVFPSM